MISLEAMAADVAESGGVISAEYLADFVQAQTVFIELAHGLVSRPHDASVARPAFHLPECNLMRHGNLPNNRLMRHDDDNVFWQNMALDNIAFWRRALLFRRLFYLLLRLWPGSMVVECFHLRVLAAQDLDEFISRAARAVWRVFMPKIFDAIHCGPSPKMEIDDGC
jgi:hypothetical protein